MNVAIRDLNEVAVSTLYGPEMSSQGGQRPRVKRTAINSQRKVAPQRFNGIHRRRRKKIMW